MPRLFFGDADADVQSSFAELLDALAGDARVRVQHRDHHAHDSGVDDCSCARTGASGVAAGFERDVHRGAARLVARGIQRNDLGVIAQVVLVKSLADDHFIFFDYRADDGIRMRERRALFREAECAQHPREVTVANAVSRRGN